MYHLEIIPKQLTVLFESTKALLFSKFISKKYLLKYLKSETVDLERMLHVTSQHRNYIYIIKIV